MPTNQHVVLASRPGVNNEASEHNFETRSCPFPHILDGQILVKTLYLSVDPYMRCQMNADTGTDYLSPWQVGKTIDGGGIGVVMKSNSTEYTVGEIVESVHWPWTQYTAINVEGLNCLAVNKVDFKLSLVGNHYSLMLGLLGLPGMAALIGIRVKGHIHPNAGQTCVVSGAGGACGLLAGQIARLEGCENVVGICGSDAKCNLLTHQLGFNAAINYKKENVYERLKESCPSGVDLYFDNVGGEISNTVIQKMKKNSHIILCGQISMYNSDLPYPPPLPRSIQEMVEANCIRRDRFLVLNYLDQFPASMKQLSQWYRLKKIKFDETIVEGLENTGAAFVGMMRGENVGKQIVRLASV